MAIPRTKTYNHTGGQVNVETDSGSVKDPETGIPVKLDIDDLKRAIADSETIEEKSTSSVSEGSFFRSSGTLGSGNFTILKFNINPSNRYYFSSYFGKGTNLNAVAFADANGTFIEALPYAGSINEAVTFTDVMIESIPTNAAYIWLNSVNAASRSLYVLKEKSLGALIKSKALRDGIKANIDKIEKLSEQIDETAENAATNGNFYTISSTRIDKGTGIAASSISGIDCTPFLPITRADQVTVKNVWDNNSNIAPIAFYDADKNYISAYTFGAIGEFSKTFAITEIPANAKYIRCTANTARDTQKAIIGISVSALFREMESTTSNVRNAALKLSDLDARTSEITKDEITGNEEEIGFYSASGYSSNASMLHKLYAVDATKTYVADNMLVPSSAWNFSLVVLMDSSKNIIDLRNEEKGYYLAKDIVIGNLPSDTAFICLQSHKTGNFTLSEANMVPVTTNEILQRINASFAKKSMKVVISGANILIRQRLNSKEDIIVSMGVSDNNNITFNRTYLGLRTESDEQILAKEVHDIHDITAPIYNTIYAPWHMFSQHGYQVPTVTAAHSLTSADLNSTWRDNAGREYTIGKISDSTLYLLPIVRATDIDGVYTRDWKSSSAESVAITSLTHVSGAAHTSAIAVTSQSFVQLKAIQEATNKKIVVDGTEVSEDGTYYCEDLVITEALNCINPFKVTAWFDANGNVKPQATTDMIELVQTFNWHGLGCRYDTTINVLEPFQFEMYGACQGMHLRETTNLPNYKVYDCVPRVKKQINGSSADVPYQYVEGQGLSVVRNATDLRDPSKMPDRVFSYLYNENTGDKKIGFASGYSLIKGNTMDAVRANNVPSSYTCLVLSSSAGAYNKAYLRAMMGGIYPSRVMPTSFVGTFSTYFSYFNPMENEGEVFYYKDGNSFVAYAHFHSAKAKVAIKLPHDTEGLVAEVVDKTDGVALLTTSVVNGKIFVSADSQPNNYIVIKLL